MEYIFSEKYIKRIYNWVKIYDIKYNCDTYNMFCVFCNISIYRAFDKKRKK